jgi:uncharacterized protein (TIGR02611 family)
MSRARPCYRRPVSQDTTVRDADAPGRGLRSFIHRRPALKGAYRLAIALVGGLLCVLGLALVPLPGPGWLVVFLGLALLGTEFAWAHRMAQGLRRMLDRWMAWIRSRRARRAGPPSE